MRQERRMSTNNIAIITNLHWRNEFSFSDTFSIFKNDTKTCSNE